MLLCICALILLDIQVAKEQSQQMGTHHGKVVDLNPAWFIIKTLLVRKTMAEHFVEPLPQIKTRSSNTRCLSYLLSMASSILKLFIMTGLSLQLRSKNIG